MRPALESSRGGSNSGISDGDACRYPNGVGSVRYSNSCSEFWGDAMTAEGLIIIVIVGVIAGWLAGQIVRGTGYGLINDLVIGVIGAFIGGWLLPRLGIYLGSGIISAIINATIGAIVLLLILRLVRGGGSWRGRRW